MKGWFISLLLFAAPVHAASVRARVLTSWAGTGKTATDAFRPALADGYRLASWVDTTSQKAAGLPPSPNLLVIEVVCDDMTLTDIQGDPSYLVLWTEQSKLQAITAGQASAISSYLWLKGVPQAAIDSALKLDGTAQEAEVSLANWLRVP